MAIDEKPDRLFMRGISKRFGGVQALKGVDFRLRSGEIHALVGENGAGKSTLMRVLSGVHTPDEGEILIDGRRVVISDTRSGLRHGISVIYQEFALAGDLSVAENIFIENLTNGRRTINWKKLYGNARELLQRLNFGQINERQIASDLSIAYQQVVEICKALHRNASILVLDEPTALLASSEVERLFELLLSLKEKGVSTVYISHRLDEVLRICDRITVLKDGQRVGTVNRNEIDKARLVNMMIGRDLKDYYPPRNAAIGAVALDVAKLNRGRMVRNVSFVVRAGEVLGVGGLVGSGRTETARAIIGVDHPSSGKIQLSGRTVTIDSPAAAFRLGIGYLPEDRKNQGVLLNMPVKHNVSLSALKRFLGFLGMVNTKSEDRFATGMTSDLNIHAASIDIDVSSLSGGNQQKVSLGRVLATESRVLILDEPTRGVDVASKVEIYRIINGLAEKGYAIVLISSEMEEIIGMCDRAIVMSNGTVVGELQRHELTEEQMIRHIMGVSAS